jgi:hypothetical protein
MQRIFVDFCGLIGVISVMGAISVIGDVSAEGRKKAKIFGG